MEGIPSMIIFVAGLVVAVVISGAFLTISYVGADSLETKGSQVSEEVKNDIQIVNDLSESSYTYDSGTNKITVYIKNTGDGELRLDNLILIVNGDLVTIDSSKIVDGNGKFWNKGEVAKVVGEKNLSPNTKVNIKAEVERVSDSIELFID